MEQGSFVYQYSARKNREIEHIREKYLPQKENKLERLKRLDRRVQSAGRTASLSIGVIGALIFGIGMCFGLGALTGNPILPYLFCALGVLIMLPAYPIYRAIAKKVRQSLTPEILRLSDELLEESRN